ncbi:MAG: maleylpyruvate isomerase family mycothiol-dependent enzyme, partial [Mycobacteriaceae bacterium]
MATRLDKQQVLDGLFGSWDDIDELLAGLSNEQWSAPTDLPGWRVHDVVAHIVGTESFLMGVPTPEPDCDVSALPHVRNDLAAMNECWVRHLYNETPAAMLEKCRSVTGERRKALLAMGDDAWNEPTATPVGLDTYGRFMRVRIFDCWMHEQDIRHAAGVWATDEKLVGAPAALAFAEIEAALGRIVGRLAGAPDGSRVA